MFDQIPSQSNIRLDHMYPELHCNFVNVLYAVFYSGKACTALCFKATTNSDAHCSQKFKHFSQTFLKRFKFLMFFFV